MAALVTTARLHEQACWDRVLAVQAEHLQAQLTLVAAEAAAAADAAAASRDDWNCVPPGLRIETSNHGHVRKAIFVSKNRIEDQDLIGQSYSSVSQFLVAAMEGWIRSGISRSSSASHGGNAWDSVKYRDDLGQLRPLKDLRRR
jgi:hypothetical protein